MLDMSRSSSWKLCERWGGIENWTGRGENYILKVRSIGLQIMAVLHAAANSAGGGLRHMFISASPVKVEEI